MERGRESGMMNEALLCSCRFESDESNNCLLLVEVVMRLFSIRVWCRKRRSE